MFISFFMMSVFVFLVSMIVNTNCLITSIFSLILAFIFVGLIFIYQGFEFFGLLTILIYVGAVALLFIFIIMTTNLRNPAKVKYHYKHIVSFWIGLFLIKLYWTLESVIFSIIDFSLVQETKFFNYLLNYIYEKDILILSYHLYTTYNIIFILFGLLLFLTMICSLYLLLNSYSSFKNVYK